MRNRQIKNIFVIIRLLVHVMIICLSFVLAYKTRFYYNIVPVLKGIPSFTSYINTMPVVIAIWLLIYNHYGFYGKRVYEDFYDDLFNIIKANGLACTIIMALTFLYREFSYSRIVLIYSWIICSIITLIFHEIIKRIEKYIDEKYGGMHRVLLIGEGKSSAELKNILVGKKNTELAINSKVEDDKNIEAFIIKNKINEIIYAKSPLEHEELIRLVNVCEKLDVDFRILPDILELRLGRILMDDYYGLPMFKSGTTGLLKYNSFVKRIVDIVLSIVILSVLFVPMLVIAVMIKLDSKGPVFHVQSRMGYKGNKFPFIKFRSMVWNADERLKELIHLNERKGPVFKMSNDPRVTRMGKFTRRYSIDELPQFFNVLRGDMSIVGPRPQVLWEANYYDDWAKKRLKVLPGITGYWQISGRSSLSYEDMIRLDIYYIENWSFGLDFKIILKTTHAVFSKRGAY